MAHIAQHAQLVAQEQVEHAICVAVGSSQMLSQQPVNFARVAEQDTMELA